MTTRVGVDELSHSYYKAEAMRYFLMFVVQLVVIASLVSADDTEIVYTVRDGSRIFLVAQADRVVIDAERLWNDFDGDVISADLGPLNANAATHNLDFKGYILEFADLALTNSQQNLILFAKGTGNPLAIKVRRNPADWNHYVIVSVEY